MFSALLYQWTASAQSCFLWRQKDKMLYAHKSPPLKKRNCKNPTGHKREVLSSKGRIPTFHLKHLLWMNLHSPVSRQTDSSIKGSGHYDHRRSVASLSSLQQILETSHPVSCIILPTTHTHQNIKPPCEISSTKERKIDGAQYLQLHVWQYMMR